MAVRWRTTRNNFPRMSAAVENLDGKKVQVGVLGGGETAWLASIHEYGCVIHVTDKMRAYLNRTGLHLKKSTTQIVIPERAFLRNGFDTGKEYVLDRTQQVIGDVIGGTMSVNQFLELVGLLLKGKVQDYARDLNSPANHPYTIDRKGSSNPLVDSGDMISSINYKVE